MCGAYRPQSFFFHAVMLKYTLCSRSNSTKSPTSDASNVSEPMLMSQVERLREVVYARRSVCFCSQSGGGASIGLLT